MRDDSGPGPAAACQGAEARAARSLPGSPDRPRLAFQEILHLLEQRVGLPRVGARQAIGDRPALLDREVRRDGRADEGRATVLTRLGILVDPLEQLFVDRDLNGACRHSGSIQQESWWITPISRLLWPRDAVRPEPRGPGRTRS